MWVRFQFYIYMLCNWRSLYDTVILFYVIPTYQNMAMFHQIKLTAKRSFHNHFLLLPDFAEHIYQKDQIDLTKTFFKRTYLYTVHVKNK